MSWFEKLMEAVFWLNIAVSPTLGGAFIGGVIYLYSGNLVIGIFLTGIGLVCGIILAERVRRRKGTALFYGEIFRTPELDERIERERKEMAKEAASQPGNKSKEN